MWILDRVPLYSLLLFCALFLETKSQNRFGSGPFSSIGITGRGTPSEPFSFVGSADFGNSMFGSRGIGTQPQTFPGMIGNGALSVPGFGVSNTFGNPFNTGAPIMPGFTSPTFINGQPQVQFPVGTQTFPNLPTTTINQTPINQPTISGNLPQLPINQPGQSGGTSSQPTIGTNVGVITPPIPSGTLSATENTVTSRFTNSGFTGPNIPTQPNRNTPQVFPARGGNNIPVGLPTGSSQGGFTPVGLGGQRPPVTNVIQVNPNAGNSRCQLSGCRQGEQCTYNDGFICPEWIPTLRCRCRPGCRVMNTFIPRNTAMRIDTCGNTCTCLRDDGVAACTVLDCQANQQSPSPPPAAEIAPPTLTDPQPPALPVDTNPAANLAASPAQPPPINPASPV